MEAKAIAKFQRVSPRKTALIARNVRGKGIEEAMNILRFTPNKPAGAILNVLKSAAANATQMAVNVDAMFVKEILVTSGPTWKRFNAPFPGPCYQDFISRTSHITVILAEGQE